MKPGIHPNYTTEAKATCVCGASMTTGSTLPTIETEICSQCHPFYTGKKKFVDSGGRVDRFKRLTEKSDETRKTLHKVPKVKKTAKKTAKKEA